MKKENNELIAAFMGFPKQGFIYDSSWDLLMPVVEKCKETLEVIATEFESEERVKFEEEIFSLNETLEDFFTNNLEAIYRRCIKFIKWYYNYKKHGRILED